MAEPMAGPAPVVIDASVGIGLIRGESIAPEVRAALRQARAAETRLLVPSIFWLEVVNSLAGRHRLPPGVILEAVAELDALELETVEVDRPLLLVVVDEMAQHGLTAYDAAYLALATGAGARLLTADVRLASAAGNQAVLLTDPGAPPAPRGIAEATARYVPSWSSWPGAAAYLRDLRARLV